MYIAFEALLSKFLRGLLRGRGIVASLGPDATNTYEEVDCHHDVVVSALEHPANRGVD